ncbi:GntR family transcriptional regulator [Amycolatopsis taiwanensis]|uniref:GntR family transcriptional regulator n=1 Tax=Amycolatopsis taiwanensis TaxID=342230 RepID=UPI0009FC74B0
MNYHLDRNAIRYLYQEMVDHIAHRIASGELAPNQVLPAEVDLARQYGVSLGTTRRATDILRKRGLVVTLPCKGTFVVAPQAAAAEETEGTSRAIRDDLGTSTSSCGRVQSGDAGAAKEIHDGH